MVVGAVQSSSGKQIDAGEASSPLLSGRGRRRHEAAQGRLVLDLSKEIGERFQALQIVDRQKLVDVGHGGPHTLRERLVTWRAKERVEPDETAAGALQAGHLTAEQFGVSPVPAITDDHHCGTGAEDAARPLIVEGLDRLADARAAGPVLDRADYVRQRGIDVPLAQLTGDPRQPSTKDEHLRVFQSLPQGVDEAQQQAGIAVHGAGDVADDDEGSGADLSFLAAQLERDAAVAQRATQRGARINELAVFGAYPAPRLASAEAPGEPLDDAACFGNFVGCALREVLAP